MYLIVISFFPFPFFISDVFRHQTFIVGMHINILSAMENFPGDEILQEAAIEALAVLGGAASGPDILHTKGAVDKILKCLKRFHYNASKELFKILLLLPLHMF